MAMNLTDDQIRSLRADLLEGERLGSERLDMKLPTVLSLVEEVERLRELVVSATGEDIAHDVQERVDAFRVADVPEKWNHLVSALAITAAKAIANGRWAVNENQRADALAAKAEAGKGLVPYATHLWCCARPKGLATGDKDAQCDCGLDAAVARWEAVENG